MRRAPPASHPHAENTHASAPLRDPRALCFSFTPRCPRSCPQPLHHSDLSRPSRARAPNRTVKMKYRALLRVILLVWLHVTIVYAAPRYPKEFTELAREFIAAKHNIPRGHQTLAQKLTMESFVKRGAAIIGIACSLKKVSYVPARLAPNGSQNFPRLFDTSPSSIQSQVRSAFVNIVSRLKNPDGRKEANKISNDIHNPINKANGSQAASSKIFNAKLKETTRYAPISRIFSQVSSPPS